MQLLRMGTGLERSQVFCSSVEGLGVPTGQQFVEYIRAQLQGTVLAAQLISPAYLSSQFCMWELGATWVQDTADTFPLLISDAVNRGDLKGPLSDRHISRLDEEGLNALHDRVLERFGLTPVVSEWEKQRGLFLVGLDAIQQELAQRYRRTPAVVAERAARYAEAAEHIHATLHRLRDAAALRILYPEGEVSSHRARFLQEVTEGVNSLAKAFRIFLQTDCRLCIKQVEAPELDDEGHSTENIVYVADLARSGGDRVRRKANQLDVVHENTDFEEILQGNRHYFFSNDLVALHSRGEYKNSHWTKGIPAKPSYVSTIVWPIRKILDTAIPAPLPTSRAEISEWQDLLGFLCVDCKSVGVFDEETDVHLGAAVADTLYHVLAPWLSYFSLLQPAKSS